MCIWYYLFEVFYVLAVFSPKQILFTFIGLAHSINICILLAYSSWSSSRASKMVNISNCCQYFQYDFVFACFGLTAPSLSPAMLSSPNAGLQNPMSSVGVGQPSAPTINTSTTIDPSSMQRAYEALGLPYSSQATGQARGAPGGPGQTAGAQNAQAQQQQLPQMRPINALGKAKQPDCNSYIFYEHF